MSQTFVHERVPMFWKHKLLGPLTNSEACSIIVFNDDNLHNPEHPVFNAMPGFNQQANITILNDHPAWHEEQDVDQDIIKFAVERNNQLLEQLVERGLFFSQNNGTPIAHPRKFFMSELTNCTLANVVVELGIFPSLSQARKNGWDKPLTSGIHSFTKKKILVEIVDDRN